MPVLTRVTLVLLVMFAVMSMAFEATFGSLLAFSVGPINVHLFDLLLLLAAVLLAHEVTLEHGQRVPAANRTVLAIVLGYCAYQIAVILPVSVAFHDLEPIAVARQLESRFALILIPFVYLVGLKYMSPRRLVAWVNTAAMLLALFALYKYATVGIQGEQVGSGAFRLRELWGGATLLFGFLILTSLFLQRPNAFAYAMALVGVIGMALTNHRSGYIALIVTVPPLLINSRRVARRAAVVLLVVLSAGLLLFAVSPTARESVIYSLRTMANPTADRNARDRLDRSRLGWDYFVANPLGDYQWSHRYYLVHVSDNFEPHNFVIQLLGQQGIVGFAFFAGLIVTTARIGWRNRRRDRMSAVMLAYFAFYLLFCLFNTNLLNVDNILLLIIPVALILARNAALAQDAEKAGCSEAGVESERLTPAHDAHRAGANGDDCAALMYSGAGPL